MTSPFVYFGRSWRTLVAGFLLACFGLVERAEGEQSARPVAVRVGDEVVVTIAPHLNDRQLDMIKGGFTTLSEMTIFRRIGDENEPEEVLATVRCSIRYDAWEETYDLLVLAEDAGSIVNENLRDYAALERGCLSYVFGKDTAALYEGPFYVRLGVKQTSSEESQKIKDWLVKQQSGVIQTLFSHMLGELSLSETVTARVLPLQVEELDKQATPDQGRSAPSKEKG